MQARAARFAARCVSIDLEVGLKDGRIHRFAAVHGATGEAFVHSGGDLHPALAALDRFAAGCELLLGHNLIGFDAPHLAAANPALRLLQLPRVDTLRLNPLAFPRNPYHHLVKHHQDAQLKRSVRNDPELDARLTLGLLHDQHLALSAAPPDLLAVWHALAASDAAGGGTDHFFCSVREAGAGDASGALQRCLEGRACATEAAALLASPTPPGWPLAYALAWLLVAGGNSVMPPWVRHQFPEAGHWVRRLRDTPCTSAACAWCREHHDPLRELHRWFGLPGFRPEPLGDDGRPLQQAIAQAAMRGEPVLGILPTGTGKSVCYQLPALSRYEKTGALTVVISPLVALMADQVAGMEARGLGQSAALNGLLSMPERADVLERLRLGGVAILLVSPEQLRSRAFRSALAQREIGAWVLDEAHCLSKWGHDFRPDYRYVGRFMRERAGKEPVPPVLCLTATAKPEVVGDITAYFRSQLGLELKVFDGGSKRTNLDFAVVPSNAASKLDHIHQVLVADLPADGSGGAIVYCASQRRTEEVATFLREKGMAAGHFHAGLRPEAKKTTQQRFIAGQLRVMAATNAFGMGIDKPDVRLVVHADVPGSLENYLQEAGRAGRDRESARCVLLYVPEDVERQFSLSARSRLTQREIQAILKSLRNLDRRKRYQGEVVATAGEILREDDDAEFQRDSVSDDTRVRTAIAWLEEARLVSREENVVNVFPSSLRVQSLAEARAKLAGKGLFDSYQTQLLAIVEALLAADPDEGISTDVLMGVGRLGPEGVRKALFELEALGIARNDLALTAFVHVAVERSSMKRLEEAQALEAALIDQLRLASPDLGQGDASLLHLRHASQRLKDLGHASARPEMLWRLVRSLAADGRSEEGGRESLGLRRIDAETAQLTLHRAWSDIATTAELRRTAAQRLLEHLVAKLPAGARGTDLLAQTTLGELLAALKADLLLMLRVQRPQRLLDHALLWLHEQECIRLNKGLAVFRPAMTIRLGSERRNFIKADFTPLKLHYDELVLQIHVMAEYAQRGLQAMADALRLTVDYFTLQRSDFMQLWLPGREKEMARQTTPQSWQAIVESLGNPVQQRIVADDREQTNVLVLAGPGSGKTRVLVHRIAYLVRVRREHPRGILALAYNRHAAVQIRQRLKELIGDDARGITVLTCHALAMRLAGFSFDGRRDADEALFAQVLQQAVALLEGQGLAPEEADEQRERLLAGFRWILVDEYQDIGADQYRLISALAGRTLNDEEGRLSLFAVGDDDQNIYGFAGASVEFIRRFETDYTARPVYLVENYRSSAAIVDAANALIEPAATRLKAEHPIVIDRARRHEPAGGAWALIDPVGHGLVQWLAPAESAQAQALAAVAELQRLAALDPAWNGSRCAVIAREWRTLEPVRACCEWLKLPVQMANEEPPQFWRLRETQALVQWLHQQPGALGSAAAMRAWLAGQPAGRWWALLEEAVADYALEAGEAELPVRHFIEWLVDWGREQRRRQNGLLLLTAHRAKGLEFDHVVVLDGGWEPRGHDEPDALRRLAYVAMTRARHTLALARLADTRGSVFGVLAHSASVRQRAPMAPQPLPQELWRRHRRVSLADIDLGFAGRQPPASPVHAAIAALQSGDELRLNPTPERWELLDRHGRCVGRLARSFRIDAGLRCSLARVAAVLVRRRSDGDPEFDALLRCESWEVVVPELVLEPAGAATNGP
jgi:ATP-dependent DNA helicase RecQ